MKRFQSPCLHHVRINGRDTSITVEPEFWEQFRLMTMERQTTIGKLLAEIDRTGRLLPYQGPGRYRVRTLSAAVRIFVFQDSWRGWLMLKHVPAAVDQQHIVHIHQPIVRHDDGHPAALGPPPRALEGHDPAR
jgi:predicted DNA-binding ribbon-helix-helix protein